MNKRRILPLIVLLLLLSGLSNIYSEVIDKILVVVNDEVITQREVDRELAPFYNQYKTMYGEDELRQRLQEAYRIIIEQLVNNKLVISEARRREIEIPEEAIESELNKVKSKFNSEEEFYLSLDSQGITIDELKENYRSSLMAKKLIDAEIGSKTTVVPHEIVEYYEDHKEEFVSPETVKVRSVLIKIKRDRGSEDSLKLVKKIYSLLKEGGDFAELSKTYSDDLYASSGGDMGYVKKGEMIKRIDDIIFSLKTGEISEILRTDLGFHIFKVEDRKEGKAETFDEVKSQIEKIIFNIKIQEKMKEFIQKLRKNAYIAFK